MGVHNQVFNDSNTTTNMTVNTYLACVAVLSLAGGGIVFQAAFLSTTRLPSSPSQHGASEE